jgi:methyl-accepting chemotaxis protein
VTEVLVGFASARRGDQDITTELEKVLAALEPQVFLSPVTAALSTVGGLVEETTDLEYGALATDLPVAVEHIAGLLAPGTLAFVESLSGAYAHAQSALEDHPLLGPILADEGVQEAGEAMLDGLLGDLHARMEDLVDAILPADVLNRLQNVLATLEQFTDEVPDEHDLLPFLVDNLIGLGIEVLDEAAEKAAEVAAAVTPVEDAEDELSALAVARAHLRETLRLLAEAVDEVDPALAEGYEHLEVGLDQVQAAIHQVAEQLAAIYAAVNDAVQAQDGAAVSLAYEASLEAVALDRVVTVDDVADAIVTLLDEFAERVEDVLRPEDLRSRAEAASDALRAAFVASPLAAVAETLERVAEEILEVVGAIPVDQVATTVEDLVGRARTQLDALGLSDAEERLVQAFDELDQAAAETLDADALAGAVRDALREIAGRLDAVPLVEAMAALGNAVAQAEATVDAVGAAAAEQLAGLADLLAELEPFDVAAASDAVIAEIDDVRERLEAMDPPALSDAERLAVAAALATLRMLDLDRAVLEPLRDQLVAASQPVVGLLHDIATRAEQLHDRLTALAPAEALGRAAASLQQAASAVDAVSGKRLLAPAHQQVQALEEALGAADPGRVLAPLEGPYDAVSDVLERLDPERWLRPAADTWTRVRRVVDRLDVGALLDMLDERRRAAFANLQSVVLDALDAAEPPELVAGLLQELRPLVEQVTGALLDEPGGLRDLGAQVWAEARFDGLFRPLEDLFEQLVELARSVPDEVLTGAAEQIRSRLGVRLDDLDPSALTERLRNGSRRLDALAPAAVLGATLALPAVEQRFAEVAAHAPDERQADAAAVAARFQDVLTLVDPHGPASVRPMLDAQHATTARLLRVHVAALDLSGSVKAYASVQIELRRVVPEFLRARRRLTRSEVLEGLYGMRPSMRARQVTEAAERLALEVARRQAALQPAVDELFATVTELVRRTSPASLRGTVEETSGVVRDALSALDPDALTDTVRVELFQPLVDALVAVDPRALRQRLNESFSTAVTAVTDGARTALDAVADEVDAEAAEVRTSVSSMIETLAEGAASTGQTLQDVLDELDRLELVALVDRLEASIKSSNEDFDREFARVHRAFGQMLAAIPV